MRHRHGGIFTRKGMLAVHLVADHPAKRRVEIYASISLPGLPPEHDGLAFTKHSEAPAECPQASAAASSPARGTGR